MGWSEANLPKERSIVWIDALLVYSTQDLACSWSVSWSYAIAM